MDGFGFGKYLLCMCKQNETWICTIPIIFGMRWIQFKFYWMSTVSVYVLVPGADSQIKIYLSKYWYLRFFWFLSLSLPFVWWFNKLNLTSLDLWLGMRTVFYQPIRVWWQCSGPEWWYANDALTLVTYSTDTRNRYIDMALNKCLSLNLQKKKGMILVHIQVKFAI